MPDRYTEEKLAIQGQFTIGSLGVYSGQRKALHGTVKVVGHETKGGIVVDADGVRAVVSPFSLLPVATVRPRGRGTRSEAPQQNGHTPTARIIRHGVPLVPAKKTTTPTDAASQQPAGAAILLARLRQLGQSPVPSSPVTPPAPRPTPPPITPPLGRDGVERFFSRWLKDWRRTTPQPHRQALIDHFNLPVYLRDQVPVTPGLFHYRQAIYFVAAAQLADPARVPPLSDIQVTLAQRFRVSEEAVKVHLKWIKRRLEADHAKFMAQQGTITVPS
jgi:hypothetical protein